MSEIQEIIEMLRQNRQTLSVAESLTGGGLGGAITAVAGASDVFLGGVIAYDVEMKKHLLKVPTAFINEFGVVSEEVAEAMAHGVRALTKSTWAISTTGVAGPGPSGDVPAGTVWVAISGPTNQSIELELQGEREEVRNATISSAILAFARILGA